MQIELGEKIKVLRKCNGKKQEDLADALGVTNQAVSRWETGGSYPDMELLPSIANFFGVTIDELFGYQSQREQKINGYFDQIQAMNLENNGKDVCVDRTIELARVYLAEFPEEKKLIYALAATLYNAGYVRHGEYHLTDENGYDVYDVERHRAYAEWKEAIKLYEKALTKLEDGDLRNRAVRELLQLYVNIGETEKVDAIIRVSPDISACREFLRISGCDGQERAKMYGDTLLITADKCANLMISGVMVNKAHLSPDDSVKVIQNAISIYGLVCSDGNYGIYHAVLAHMHLYLSEHLWLADHIDEAFAALDTALVHAQKYDAVCKQAGAMYTAPLLRLSQIERKSSGSSGLAVCLSEDWPWWRVPDCSEVKSKMQADPRWAEWVKRTRE